MLVSAGLLAVWTLAVLATALALKTEQEELLDLELRETARLFQPVLARRWREAGAGAALPPPSDDDPQKALVYLLMDADGAILLRSRGAAGVALPDRAPESLPEPGYVTTESHVLYVTQADADGLIAAFGDSRGERREAYVDSLLAFLVPMLAILPLAYLMTGWVARAALRPLDRLRAEIAARGEGRLDPIDADGQPQELRAITAVTNGLMARLGQALDGERAFATNAAHELRTPVAVALAQTQRLRATVPADAVAGVERIEAALDRMGRLVARLLQLARADAGIGAASEPADLRALLGHVLEDARRDPRRSDRLRVVGPGAPVRSPIDPDAFAILAGNLVDNAFQHSPDGTEVAVTLTADGTLRVVNAAAPCPENRLATLTRRFGRATAAGAGFGLGLHIADAIARQSGGILTLASPAPGRADGFEARFTAPPAA